MRARILSSLVLAGALLAPPLHAREPTDDAASEKQRGDAAMDGYRLDEALEAYTHAYNLGHDPAVLYNRGRVYQARSEWTKALDDLEAFDRDAPAALKAKVPKLAELVAAVRQHVSTLTVVCDVAGARVYFRGADLGVTPLPPQRVNAGSSSAVRVEAEGYVPFSSEETLEGGLTTKVAVHLERVAGPLVITRTVPAKEKPKTLVREWWFWTGVGVVAAAAVVSIVLIANTEKSPSNGENFSPGRVSGPLVVSW